MRRLCKELLRRRLASQDPLGHQEWKKEGVENCFHFGKHKGKTFLDVYLEHNGYAVWAVNMGDEAAGQLREFQQWVLSKVWPCRWFQLVTATDELAGTGERNALV